MRGTDPAWRTIQSLCVRAERDFVEIPTPADDAEMIRRVEPEVERTWEIYNCLSRHGLLEQGTRLLEVGIGYGTIAFSLGSLAAGVLISSLEHPHRQCLKNTSFRKELDRYGIEVAAVDLTTSRLPWGDGSFDVVIFSETIEHLPPTIVPGVLDELSRVTKEGGYVLATSNNLTSLLNRLQFVRGKNSFIDLPLPVHWASGTYGHIRFYTVDEMRALGDRVGLDVIECTFTDAHMKSYRQGQAKLKSYGMGVVLAMERFASTFGWPQLREGWHILYHKHKDQSPHF